MERNALHQAFFGRFAERSPPPRISEEDLARVETKLGVFFPESYRTLVIQLGAFRMPGLLRVIVDRGIALHALQEFLPANEVVQATAIYCSGGMPEDLIGIASDCMGNLVCFSKTDIGARRDDAPVYFFDHEFADVSSEKMRCADSFDAFLEQYVKGITNG